MRGFEYSGGAAKKRVNIKLYVVSREPYWGGKYAVAPASKENWNGKPADRIVVCATHARDTRSHRYLVSPNDWAYKHSGPGAVELVEEEYR